MVVIMQVPDTRRLAVCLWLAVALGAVGGPARAQSKESVIPLGPAQVRELRGEAWAHSPPPTAPRPLHVNDRVSEGQKVQTGAAGWLELVFPDGTLLRVGPAAEVTLMPQQRRVALHRGRVLVAADRMIGGLAVLTRRAALLPEGTTYLAETSDSGDAVMVLEGVVCACTVATNSAVPPPSQAASPAAAPTPGPAPRPAAAAALPADGGLAKTRDQMVLPGEAVTLTWSSGTAQAGGQGGPHAPRPGTGAGAGPAANAAANAANSASAGALKLIQISRPQPKRLEDVLRSEPLIVGFAAPLPSLRVINDQSVEQRRGALARRNDRLRRELFWKRPPHAPVKLPPFFTEPDSVIIRYVYPD